jgi:hypothetical protein
MKIKKLTLNLEVKDLTDSVNAKTKEVERLKDRVNRAEKTLKKNLN